MRYFLDWEFYEDGERIHPISLGMVREDGRELYFEVKYDHVELSQWLKDHVVPHLTWAPEDRVTPEGMAALILDFVGDDPTPEFWAYFADYDWICLCQAFGTMMDLPLHFPKYCLDIQQYWAYTCGRPPKSAVMPAKPKNVHNALADARWNLDSWRNLTRYHQETLSCIARTGEIPEELLRQGS